MAVPTPRQIREALAGLNPEEQDQFLSELEKRQATVPAARLQRGEEASVQAATQGAEARSAAPPPALSAAEFRRVEEIPTAQPAPGAPGGPPARPESMLVPLAGIGTIGPGVAAPIAAATSLGLGVVGSGLGGHAGRYIGGGIGLPGVGETAGRIAGGLAGGLGGIKNIQQLAKLANFRGVLKLLAEQAGPEAAAAGKGMVGASANMVEPLAATAAQLVKQRTFRTVEEALKFLKGLNPEQAVAVGGQIEGGVAAPVAESVGAMIAPAAAGTVARTPASRAAASLQLQKLLAGNVDTDAARKAEEALAAELGHTLRP